MARTMRGLAPVAKPRADHNWADADEAKKLTRSRLMWWLEFGAQSIASQAKKEAPHGTGHGRGWINATVDTSELAAYAGIIGPIAGKTKGGVPTYMGMIERGITPHKVSLKHRGLRTWFARTFAEDEAKPGPSGKYRSVMVWKSTGTFGGIRRMRKGGKTAIPWLSRAIKHELPTIRTKLRELARAN